MGEGLRLGATVKKICFMFSYLYSFTSDSNTGLLFMCADVHPYE